MDVSNTIFEIIDIVPPTDRSEQILTELMVIYNNEAAFTCHGDTNRVIVMYINNIIVGGGLLRDTPRSIVIKRLCTTVTFPEHSSQIVLYLQNYYHATELHVSATNNEASLFYRAHNFVKRNKSRNCMCKIQKSTTHLVWSGSENSTRVNTRHQQGEQSNPRSVSNSSLRRTLTLNMFFN